MRVLILGNGSREHAVAQQLFREGHEVHSFRTKTNAGLDRDCRSSIISEAFHPSVVSEAAQNIKADLVFPCCEESIFAGIYDVVTKAGIACFGPTQQAARLEYDKPYAKKLVRAVCPKMVTHYDVVSTVREVDHYAQNCAHAVTVKAAMVGKENSVSFFNAEDPRAFTLAKEVVQRGCPVLLEQTLAGFDFSVYCFSDGKSMYSPFIIRDYPFLREGNHGEKTGGMGCISQPNLLRGLSENDVVLCRVCIEKVLGLLRHCYGITFVGVLVAQFIKTQDGVRFNEFDVRPGDSEFINVLKSLETPLGSIMTQSVTRSLLPIKANKLASVTICHVPPGYPRTSQRVCFKVPPALEEDNNIFFGVSSKVKGGLYQSGNGRSLVTCGTGLSLSAARNSAQLLSEQIGDVLIHRKDIGTEELMPI